MLFRFLEYDYSDLSDMCTDAKFLAGIKVKENYESFLLTMKNSIGFDIIIKDNWYIIDEIKFHYNGGEDDLFVCNIYCVGY